MNLNLTPQIPTHEVVKLMRIALEKAFECRVEFSDDVNFYVVFFADGDDMLTMRVAGREWWVAEHPRIEAPSLFKLGQTMLNAVGLARVLQLSAKWAFEEPTASTPG